MLHSLLLVISCLGISLSDFGQEIINLFIKSMPESIEKNTLFLSFDRSDTLSYLSIYALSESYRERTSQDITILGKGGENVFFSGESCKDSVIPDDPYSWSIVMDNDGNVNPFLTRKHYVEDSIDDIISIFHKFGFGSVEASWADNYVFSSLAVEHPAEFIGGDTRLLEKIREAFSETTVGPLQGKIPIAGSLIVERDGSAFFERLIVKSEDEKANNIAITICKEIAQETFIPASHRGIRVKSRYVVFFPYSIFKFKSDLINDSSCDN